jgi:membrane protease YdiL (CAAX protease family)
VEAFGGWGIIYVSLLFAIVYIGFIPVKWVGFIFIISLYFSWVVKATKSILGVALAHSICNIAVYLAIPFL